MNAIQLKALLLSVITELKFGQPLHRNGIGFKGIFKQMVGLSPRATNVSVLKQLQRVYAENGMTADFDKTIARFKAEKFL